MECIPSHALTDVGKFLGATPCPKMDPNSMTKEAAERKRQSKERGKIEIEKTEKNTQHLVQGYKIPSQTGFFTPHHILHYLSTSLNSIMPVTLVTSDNESFDVDKDVAERSVLIKNMLEGQCFFFFFRPKKPFETALLINCSCTLFLL